MGMPGGAVVGKGTTCQMGLFVEDRARGAVMLVLAPAQHDGFILALDQCQAVLATLGCA